MQVFWLSHSSYNDGDSVFSFNFSTYSKSFYSIFLFLTKNNTPEVILAPYPQHRFITLFIFLLLHVNSIMLAGLVIGISYYKMKLVMANEIEQVCKSHIKRQVFEKLLDYPKVTKTFIKKFISMYLKGKIKPYFSVDQMLDEQFIKSMLPKSASQFIFESLKKMKSYEFFYSLIDFVIVVYAMFIIQMKDFHKPHYFLYMILLCSVSSLDFVHIGFFSHLDHFDRTWKTIISFLLNVGIIVLSTVLLIDDVRTVDIVKIWGFLCIMKVFRFAIFYFKFDRQKLKNHIFYPFLQYTGDLTAQLIVVYIFFSMLGLNAFGGLVNDYTMELYNKQMQTDYDYVDINFNTFLNSFVSFYLISLNDNWPIVANLGSLDQQNYRKHMRFIFLVFKFLVDFIFINSLIAFIIEIFQEYEKQAVYGDQDLDINTSHGVRKPTYDELSVMFKEEPFHDLDKTFR